MRDTIQLVSTARKGYAYVTTKNKRDEEVRPDRSQGGEEELEGLRAGEDPAARSAADMPTRTETIVTATTGTCRIRTIR